MCNVTFIESIAPKGVDMEVREGPPLCSHLADFETTTSAFLRQGQAIALLNFAALFHEVIYLPDTALGDHELIIKSFHEKAHSGLFHHLKALIENGILRVLMRAKVVVGEEIRVPSNPTIRQIFEGWLYRDKTKWKGEQGYTTEIDKKIRLGVLQRNRRCNRESGHNAAL